MKGKELLHKFGNLKTWQKTIAVIVIVIVILAAFSLIPEREKSKTKGMSFEAAEGYSEDSYISYVSAYGDADYNGTTVKIDLLKGLVQEDTSGVTSTGSYEGRENVVVTADEGTVSWNFDVAQSGLYAIQMDYYTVEGYGSSIERNLMIDGAYPFKEAVDIEFSRAYMDENGETPSGKIQRPNQVEKYGWLSAYVSDAYGYYAPAMYFYLNKGSHTISFESVKEPMAVSAITLVSENVAPKSYEEVLAATTEQGAKDVTGALDNGVLYIQAENALEKSDPTLYAKADTSSTRNQPYSFHQKLLNTIGGTGWKYPNQWITWEFSVPESGYYYIGARAKQETAQDIYYNRSLYIDGELPFLEAENVHFYYDNDWQIVPFGESDSTEGWKFYLEAGDHTVTLKNTVGDLSSMLTEAGSILDSLSAVNLDLLAILSTTPDTDRDYQIAIYMPETLAELKKDEERLQNIYDAMLAVTGERGSLTSQLEQLLSVINKMYTKPNEIASCYSRYRDLVGSFGEWITTVREQPLQLDYLYVAETGTKLDTAKDGFGMKLASQAMGFINSFSNDYTVLSNSETESDNTITVWIGSGLTGGRDQAMALNQMIVDNFTAETGIGVNLQLVPAATLKTATFAGRGPDVALQVDQAEPVDFALRGAACDLTQFADYEEVAARFSPNAVDPFLYDGGVYAIPETMSFPMLFYRTDIMEELGIDVSKLETWDGIVEILATLQSKNMDFAMPSSISNLTSIGMQSYSMFLYQMGGQYYTDDQTASALGTKTALDAFEYWTDFYMQYGLSTDYSFENRFRTGEMPIGIAEYTNYNLLSISAPEIKGKWAMTVLPGMKQADGTIDNVAPIIVQGCMMLEDCENKDAAWEFVKWWTDADTQYEFGEQLEAVMGAAARYNTANEEALLRFAWPGSDRRAIEQQIGTVQGIPQVPGGYYTSRYLNFAKLAVINDFADPRVSLMEYSEDVTEEITIKRTEFHLDTDQ